MNITKNIKIDTTGQSIMNTIGLGEATKITGKAKNTIIKAINNGKLSAQKNNAGHFRLEPSELFRVFPPKTEKNIQENSSDHIEMNTNNTNEQALLIEQLKQEIEHHKNDVYEWKERYKNAEEERKETQQRLNNLLTDQRPSKKKGLLGRIFG